MLTNTEWTQVTALTRKIIGECVDKAMRTCASKEYRTHLNTIDVDGVEGVKAGVVYGLLGGVAGSIIRHVPARYRIKLLNGMLLEAITHNKEEP